jgi:hypothetical protein
MAALPDFGIVWDLLQKHVSSATRANLLYLVKKVLATYNVKVSQRFVVRPRAARFITLVCRYGQSVGVTVGERSTMIYWLKMDCAKRTNSLAHGHSCTPYAAIVSPGVRRRLTTAPR